MMALKINLILSFMIFFLTGGLRSKKAVLQNVKIWHCLNFLLDVNLKRITKRKLLAKNVSGRLLCKDIYSITLNDFNNELNF